MYEYVNYTSYMWLCHGGDCDLVLSLPTFISFTEITVAFTTTGQIVTEGETAQVCVNITRGTIAADFPDVISVSLEARSRAEIEASGMFIAAIGT